MPRVAAPRVVFALVAASSVLGSLASVCPDDPDVDLCDEVEANAASSSTGAPSAAMMLMLTAGMSSMESARLPAAILLVHYTLGKAFAADSSTLSTCADLKAFYKKEACCGNPGQRLSTAWAANGTGVTKAMVEAAQKEWGDGIVKIAAAKVKGEDFEKAAHEHIMNLYAYAQGPVLFKPTLAAEQQFRSTLEGALSYFVATNGHAAEDKGFAIKGWTKVRFVNEEIITSGNNAMAMGNYFFTTPENKEVKVEYSFGYALDAAGKVRINLHHSSMPYGAAAECQAVTRKMVEGAQKAWGEGIVNIASAKANGQNYGQVADDLVKTLYAYSHGGVLFKPTLAAEQQFRSTLEGALSYFVAKNGNAAEDKGFAIKGWTKVRFVNEEIVMTDNTAMAMGNYYFTNSEGETKVEYSFGYVLDEAGKLRINLHHSSLPYAVATVHSCDGNVTKKMVEDAQKEWGDGIVSIASANQTAGDHEQVADDLVKKLYAYSHGGVLFKPTLAAEQQFRSTFEGALSYFVAANGNVTEDKGFAIKGWTAVRFENQEIIISGNTAMAMGNYYFTNSAGETKVEYSFGYVLDEAGKLRINLHHSSLPYSA